MKIIPLIIMLAILTSACTDAQCSGGGDCTMPSSSDADNSFIVALAYSSTVQGLTAAAQGAPGTFVMSNGDILMFVWKQGHYPAFAMLEMYSLTPVDDFAANAGGNGTVADIKSMGELIKYLKSVGWINVPKGQVPHQIVEALATQSAWLSLTSIELMPTFVVIPANQDIFDIYPERIIQ